MRQLSKLLLTLAIVFGVAITGFYYYRKQVAKKHGQTYAFADAPGDFLAEIVGIFSSSDGDGPPPGVEPSRHAQVHSGESTRATGDALVRGREQYFGGDYDEAQRLLRGAALGGSRDEAGELLDRARLFGFLVEGVTPGSELGGPPIALITMKGGKTMLATVTDENDHEISFRTKSGIGARVLKLELADLRVARTHDAKRDLYEAEYNDRHDALRSAGDHLELALFSRSHGLTDHVTYLLEQSLVAPGDEVELALFEKLKGAEARRDGRRVDTLRRLMQTFFPSGSYTARVKTVRRPPQRPASQRPAPHRPTSVGSDPGGESDVGAVPRSGIGGVGTRTRRIGDPKVDALLVRADDLRGIGDDHYVKAFPGMKDRALHRKKAIDAYVKARELYEEVEEKWGIGLDRTFRHLNERIYHLRKDTPIR